MGTAFRERMALVPLTPAFSPFVVHLYGGTSGTEIAKAVGLKSAQALHHFLGKSPWSVTQLRERRLSKTLAALKGNAITVVIDETGDRKKGKRTAAM